MSVTMVQKMLSGSIFTVEGQRKTLVCTVDLYTVLVCLFVSTTLNTAKFHDDIDTHMTVYSKVTKKKNHHSLLSIDFSFFYFFCSSNQLSLGHNS